ncbi:retrovirus-related pol polyprotein from transposon TNT 1-94, partial [Tanacetum coccineum]
MSFVGSSAEKVTDGSTIKGHKSTLPGSVCLRTCLEPDEWIKDSGCSKHMTGNKSLFSTYKAYDGGNGNATSAWFDNWSTLCPLSNVISNRDIYSACYRGDSKVFEIINQGSWTWPNEWFLKYSLLGTTIVPNLSNSDDRLSWSNLDNSDVGFSVAAVWDCIRPRSNEVEWFHVVWFSYQIPRHANYLWLVLKRKLKTQDLMRPWDISCATNLNSLICSLCGAVSLWKLPNSLMRAFEMSMMGELNFFLGLQIKQMKDGIFFNQSKYIKEMLKKFGLEDSKPTKTPMSTKIKLTKDDEADSVDSSKYR